MDHLESYDCTFPSHSFEQVDEGHVRSTKASGIFSKIKKAFFSSRPQIEEGKSLPKTCCLHKNAERLRSELTQIRSELLDGSDGEMLPMVEEVIDPLLRNVQRIQRGLHKEKGVEEYHEWTQKARLWVELYSKDTEKEKIKAAIADHAVQKTMERIDRDINLIEDYLQQHLDLLKLHPEEQSLKEHSIKKAVAPHIENLLDLRVPPVEPSLKTLDTWRKSLDRFRAKHFNSALRAIEKR